MPYKFIDMFSSMQFVVLALTFDPLIFLELIFVTCEAGDPNSFSYM